MLTFEDVLLSHGLVRKRRVALRFLLALLVLFQESATPSIDLTGLLCQPHLYFPLGRPLLVVALWGA